MADLEIIDAHSHILRSKEHGAELYSYFLRRMPQTGFPAEPCCNGTVPEALNLMKKTGVKHMNFLMFTWSGRYYRDGLYTLPDDPARRAKAEKDLRSRIVDRIKDNNEWALSAIKENPNLSFFCGIDPVLMDEKTLLAEIEDKTKRGARGVKMVPNDLQINGNDRRLWPVYDYCQSRGIPVFSEASGRPNAPGRPSFFGEALKDFPRLKLGLAHLGHDPKFGQGADAEVAELANKYENFFTDVSLRFPEVGEGHITPQDMVAHLRRIGIDHVMYGSNFAILEMLRPDQPKAGAGEKGPQITRSVANLQVLKTLPLTDDERERIASKNFKRLIGLKS